MKISIKVTPNAKHNEIVDDVTDMLGARCLRCYFACKIDPLNGLMCI